MFLFLFSGFFSSTPAQNASPPSGNPWIGLTTKNPKSLTEVNGLMAQIPVLASMGMNVLVWEVDYSFDYKSHPEVKSTVSGYNYCITKDQARAMAALCKQYGVRLVPLFNSFGHQSVEDDGPTYDLLKKYPAFDETNGQFPNNSGVYARCWCPRAPGLNAIYFDLLRELVDAFQCDAVHVGMDEIFHIGVCPLCKGTPPYKLLTDAIRQYHDFLKDSLHVEMMMWGDRLIPSTLINHTWEASDVNTAAAVDSIPKDIIICDWHYETSYTGTPAIAKGDYPTIPYFVNKGFSVWPCGFDNTTAITSFITDAEKNRSDKMLGYLASVWESRSNATLSTWSPITTAYNLYGKDDTTPPSDVVQNPASTASGAIVQLSWQNGLDAESGISGYEIYRDTVPGPVKVLKKLVYNVQNFSDSSAVKSKKYYYRLKAVNRNGMYSTNYSNEVSIVAQETSIADNGVMIKALKGPDALVALRTTAAGIVVTLPPARRYVVELVDVNGRTVSAQRGTSPLYLTVPSSAAAGLYLVRAQSLSDGIKSSTTSVVVVR